MRSFDEKAIVWAEVHSLTAYFTIYLNDISYT